MAMQNNMTVSSFSSLAEQQAMGAISAKERKKNLLLIAHLLTTLKEEVERAKAGIQQTQAPHHIPEGPGNNAFMNAMAEMVYTLQLLEQKIAQFQAKNAQWNADALNVEVTIAKKSLKQLQHKIHEMNKKEKIFKDVGVSAKVVDYLTGAVALIAGILTLQPEIMAMSISSFLAASGAYDEMSKYLGKGVYQPLLGGALEKLGVSSSKADIASKWMAQATVVAGATGIAAATGNEAQATEEVGDAALTTVPEDTLDTLELSEETTASTTQTTEEGTLNSLGKTLKKINVFNKFNKRVNMGLIVGMQSASSNGLAPGLVELSVEQIKDKKTREAVKIALELTIGILTLLTALGGGAAVMEQTGANPTSRLGEIATKLAVHFNGLYLCGQALELVPTITQAGYQVDLALVQYAIAKVEAALILANQSMGLNDEQMESDQHSKTQMIKNEKIGMKTAQTLASGMKGFADAFTEVIPVK